MTDRWKRWMAPTDEGGPGEDVFRRARLGPARPEEPDVDVPTRGTRIVAGVTAFAIFAAAALLGWHAFTEQKPVAITPSYQGAPLVVALRTDGSSPPTSTWTYRGVSMTVPQTVGEVPSRPWWRIKNQLLVHVTVGSPLALKGFPDGTSAEIATGHGTLGAWRALPLQGNVAQLPTSWDWYVVRIRSGPASDAPAFAVAVLLLKTTAVARIDIGASSGGCATGTLSVFAADSGRLEATGISADGRADCTASPHVTPSSLPHGGEAGRVDLPLGGVLAIQGHGARIDATLYDQSRFQGVYPLALQEGRVVLGPPGSFILAVRVTSAQVHGTVFFRIGIDDTVDWQPSSPTPPPTAPSGQPSASVSSQVASCNIDQLRLGPTSGVSEATGQHTRLLSLTNVASTPCSLLGYPGVAVLDVTGRPIPFVYQHAGDQMVTSNPPALVVLAPGSVAYAAINKYRCDLGDKAVGKTLVLTLPGGTRTLTVPVGRRNDFSYCGAGDPGSTVSISPFEPTAAATLAH